MSNKDLRLSPQHAVKWSGIWWYETPKGLEFQIEIAVATIKEGQVHFEIPWSRLRAALKRKDKKQRR